MNSFRHLFHVSQLGKRQKLDLDDQCSIGGASGAPLEEHSLLLRNSRIQCIKCKRISSLISYLVDEEEEDGEEDEEGDWHDEAEDEEEEEVAS